MESPHRYSFGDVVVDTATLQILKAGVPVPVEPKSFRVLLYLIEHRARVVPKEELMGAVWKDSFVTDNALTRAIAQLRKALGDHVKDARYIETVPTVGYRFIAGMATPPPAPPGNHLRWVALGLILAVAAGLALFWRAGHTRQPRNLSVYQLTTSGGLDLTPTFSPDGSSIAYSSDRSGRFELYVRPVNTSGRDVAITSDGGQNVQPAWSPDGASIAYTSVGKRGIFVAPALGGFPKRLTSFGSQPTWSRDGRFVAFRSSGVYSLATADYLPTTLSTIWVVPAGGGEPRQVTQPGSPAGRHSSPTWSPDGQWLAFIVYETLGTSHLWMVSADGATLRQIPRAERESYLQALWSPDGDWIYFSGFRASEGFGVWRIPAVPKLSDAEPIINSQVVAAIPRDIALSADGRRLAYNTASASSNIWDLPVSPKTGLATGPAKPLTSDTSLRNTHAVFSPDGSRIAYYVRRAGTGGDIFVMNADGSQPVAVTSDREPDFMPSWTPDGQSVVYASARFPDAQFRMVSLGDGKEQTLLKTEGKPGSPKLSPDGQEVLYHMFQKGILNLWIADIATGAARQLTFDNESMGYGCWSPDGRHIAFEIARGEDTHLALLPREGGEPVQLTHEPGHAWPFSFSPGGSRIAFAAFRDGVWNLWWYSLATKEQKPVTNYTSLRTFVRYPSWSPQGDRMIFEFAETKGNVFYTDLAE
ncbi:MAG: PD40 domain-containing protein [Bryobacterales bacterium]|nr:PD40 domain-containing protein [Bryobacterales bacterium]